MAYTVTVPTEATDEIADFLEYNIISEDVDWFWKELLKIATARTPQADASHNSREGE